MPLRCSKLIYLTMGLCNRAVSHWAAKDATLSLQGHMSEPQAAWDGINAATGHKLTDYFSSWHHSSDSYPSILRGSSACSILIIWHQKLLVSPVTVSRIVTVCVCTCVLPQRMSEEEKNHSLKASKQVVHSISIKNKLFKLLSSRRLTSVIS